MKYIISFFISLYSICGFAQDEIVLDKVIAVIGNEIATKSEFESKYAAYSTQNNAVTDNLRCEVFEDVLYSKVLLNQAKLDSVDVSESQVEGELDRRMRYYISQIGSEQAMEEYYKKPVAKIKAELKKSLREQMQIQAMQGKISSDVTITPAEVRAYFEKIPEDSLPLVNAEVEVAQIVINTPTTQASINEVKVKLREYKKRVEEGEKFSTLAVLYSEDQGSAVKGGEIGFVGKAEVEPEFGAAAFKLKAGNVSPVVKTRYGYHIIQMIERRGTKVNVRHILLKPKFDDLAFEQAKIKIDSIGKLIALDSISFEEAAKRYSDDEETKKNGGIIVNPYTTSSMTAMDDLDPSLFFIIDKMDEGEVSGAAQISDPRQQPGFRIVRLNKRTEPHRASLKEDYQQIKSAALAEKEQDVLQEWVGQTIEKTYLDIEEEYIKDCEFMQNWSKKVN